MNSGGWGFKTAKSARGSPLILQKHSGSSAAMGLTLLVTGLYFFFVNTAMAGLGDWEIVERVNK